MAAPPETPRPDDFAEVAATARFLSPERYAWRGIEVAHDARRVVSVRRTPGTRYASVVLEVAQMLYDLAYARPTDPLATELPQDRLLQDAFVRALEEALGPRWSWMEGWRAAGRESGRLLVVGPQGERRSVEPRRFRAGPRGQPGALRVPAGSAALQPGWFHVRGARDHPSAGPGTLRLYWDLAAAGAAPLVCAAPEELDRTKVPFHLKVMADPQRFARADAAVLYLPRAAWRRAGRALGRVHDALAPYLRGPVPMFTLALAPGLGLAEDPGGRDSFGTHRCRLAAEGLWEAHARGLEGSQAVAEAVRERFRAAGLRPDAPHLHPGGRPRGYRLAVAPPRLPLPGGDAAGKR